MKKPRKLRCYECKGTGILKAQRREMTCIHCGGKGHFNMNVAYLRGPYKKRRST